MILEKIQAKFPSEILETHQERNELAVVIRKDRVYDFLKFLKEDPELDFDLLMDVCGADYLNLKTGSGPRFEVVYHLYSINKNHRLRVRVKVPEDDMKLASVTSLWEAANWSEREAYDMFGFVFEGHPHLKRLLVFEGFEGHPLRKDYPIGKRQKIPTPEERI